MGSGTVWKRHINKHGKEHVKTIWLSEPYTDTELIKEIALHFSLENNIVESKAWANLILENGLDGTTKGSKHSAETKKKMSIAWLNRAPFSDEARAKMSAFQQGKIVSEETKRNMSVAQKGRKFSEEPKKNLAIAHQNREPASEETRAKLSVGATGRIRQPHSDQTKLKMSESAKNRPPVAEETGRKIAASNTGKVHTDATKELLSNNAKNRPKKECPHCGKMCDITGYPRWHGDKCKHKPV